MVDKAAEIIPISYILLPWDANVREKYKENGDRYKDLAMELSRRWTRKALIFPICIGTLGCMKETVPSR